MKLGIRGWENANFTVSPHLRVRSGLKQAEAGKCGARHCFSSPSGEERIETPMVGQWGTKGPSFSSPSGEERIETLGIRRSRLPIPRFSSPSGEERIETKKGS